MRHDATGSGRLREARTQRAVARLLSVVAAASLCACANLPTGHGFIELDENTDPRFVKQTEPGKPIGSLEARGAVFLNGRRVSSSSRVSSGDHIRTGAGGWARLRFTGVFSDRCEQGIEILEFESGRLYGETDRCDQHVTTRFGRAQGDQQGARYHVAVGRRGAEVTVFEGRVLVGPPGDTPLTTAVGIGQEVRLERGRVSRPRRVPEDVLRERLGWTSVIVPFLINKNEDAAIAELENLDLRVGRVAIQENDGDGREGTVARHEPSRGDRVQRGTRVDLWIWGPAPKPIPAPKLVGMSLRQARSVLQRQGLRVGSVKSTTRDPVAESGRVQRQEPAAGRPLKPGKAVKLWVAPATQSVPTRVPTTHVP